jgi:pimeloyl-ACP methyl ester carboxylesterase
MEVLVSDCSIHAYTGGRPFASGLPAIVFIHGAQHDHSVWGLQSRYFAHHGHGVLAIDLPGHGRSEGPLLRSIEDLAEWVVRLLDAVQVPRAALVGHSMGSLIALETAARHPQRIDRIALIGSAVPMPVADVLLDAARSEEPRAIAMINAWSYSPRARLGGNTIPGMWMVGTNRRLMQRQAEGVLHTDLAACNAYAAGLDSAARVACPALLVVGSRDQMTPPRATKPLAEALPRAQTVTIEDSGHALMAERPDGVLDALRAFLIVRTAP